MFIICYLTNLFLFAFVLTKKYNKIKAIEDHFYHKVIKAKCTEAVAGRCSIQKVWGQQLINPNLCVCVCVCVCGRGIILPPSAPTPIGLPLTLFSMGIFWAAHRWGVDQKVSSSLKPIKHILQWWTWHSYILRK